MIDVISSSRCFTLACRSLACAGIVAATSPVANATTYDESAMGDLSGNPAIPTNIGPLTPGSNRLSGTTNPSGTFDTIHHTYSILDNDYATFTVPAGYTLSNVSLGPDSSIAPTDRLFLGIAQGASVSVAPSFMSAAGLLGWTLVSPSMLGTNLLPSLGLAAPADFPSVGGATGFTGALPSGQYTLWILDGDANATYDFALDVAPPVPEPESWAMLVAGMSLTGLALRRRARPR